MFSVRKQKPEVVYVYIRGTNWTSGNVWMSMELSAGWRNVSVGSRRARSRGGRTGYAGPRAGARQRAP